MTLLETATFVSALLLVTACPADDGPSETTTPGETNPQDTDPQDTDPGETDPQDTDVIDTDPQESDTDPIDTDGEPEADCSCYFNELAPPDFLYCAEPEEIVPGCDPPAPTCDTIEVTRDEFSDPIQVVVDTPDALDCVIEALGAGESIAFEVSTGNNLGGDTDTYWPVDGAYVRIGCSLYDNPPETLVVERLEAAAADVFATCLDAEGEPDPVARLTCLMSGLTPADEALPVCG